MNKMKGDTLLTAEKENLLHLRQANTPVNKIPHQERKKKKKEKGAEPKPWTETFQWCPRAYWWYPLLLTGIGGGLYSMLLLLFRAARFAQELPEGFLAIPLLLGPGM